MTDAGRKQVLSDLRSLSEQLHSVVEEAEAIENEPSEQLKLEATMKRYTFNNKTVRRIHISERFNTREQLEKYDRATEKGHRYCTVTITYFPTKSILLNQPPEQ
jgi:predicted phage-related endonuclease